MTLHAARQFPCVAVMFDGKLMQQTMGQINKIVKLIDLLKD
jgi:hypothetical protein